MTTPLTDAKIAQGWKDTFSTNNPFCPCDLKTFTKAARWAERALLAQPSVAPGSEIAHLCALKDRDAITVNLLKYGNLGKHHARAVADAILGQPTVAEQGEAVAYQRFDGDKWVECSHFVAYGWGNMISPNCRALYVAPPAPGGDVRYVLEPTDAMALAFHSALTDGSLGSEDAEDIKTGLRAALAALQSTQAPTAAQGQDAAPAEQPQHSVNCGIYRDGGLSVVKDNRCDCRAARAKE